MLFPTRDYLKAIQSERKQPDQTFAAAFLEIMSRLDGLERAVRELRDANQDRDDIEEDE